MPSKNPFTYTALAIAALASQPASAEEPEPVEPMPITDPSWEPQQWGLGHEPDVQAAFNTPTILFINFDGGQMNGGCGNDSHNNCSTIINGEMTPFPGDDSKKAAVVQSARSDVEDFGVIIVGERPPDNQPYAMVMVGLPNGQDPGSIGGVAPGQDCGNTNPNITSFCFLVNASSNTIATVVHQEAAHTWGLEHVDDEFDNLFPTTGGASDPKYQDKCGQIVGDTDLTPIGGQCNSVHTMFCQSGQQNSYREMSLLFGPPVADNVPPTVTIDSPADGSVFDYDEPFTLTITLDDDRRPQVLDTTIFFDETDVLTKDFINTTLDFPINGGDPPMGHGLTNGEHTIRVEIADEWGNPASAEVSIVIENGPEAPADDSGSDGGTGMDSSGTSGGSVGDGGLDGGVGDGGDDKGCGCRADTPAGAFAIGWLGLLLFRRRNK